MAVCFICDAKLLDKQTQVCTSITPHGKLPFPEKIAELMGEEFIVISTPNDYMCKQCTSLLLHMDSLENDMKRIKNALLSFIQKKHGLLSCDQPKKTLDVVNGNLKTSEQLEDRPKKKPLDNAHAVKIYKCSFCSFMSKNLEHVRFHVRTHSVKKKPDQTAAATKPLPVPSQKKIYKCEICSKYFDDRAHCLLHINKHKRSNKKEAEDVPSAVSSSMNFNLNTPKSQDNQQKESAMDVDGNAGQQDKNKGKKTAELEGSPNSKKSELENHDNDLNKVEENENKISIMDIESMLAAIHDMK